MTVKTSLNGRAALGAVLLGVGFGWSRLRRDQARGGQSRMRGRRDQRGGFARGGVRVVAVPKCRPREHPRRGGSTISSANVSRLEPAWTFKLTGTARPG